MAIHPLPPVHISSILGLLELLDDAGGKEDLSALGGSLKMDLGDLLQLLEGARLLGLVAVREGDIMLTPTGTKAVRGDIATRKAVIGHQVRELDVVGEVVKILATKRTKRIPRQFFLDLFERHLPAKDARVLLATLVDWGRYAQLLDYRETTGEIVLVGPLKVSPE